LAVTLNVASTNNTNAKTNKIVPIILFLLSGWLNFSFWCHFFLPSFRSVCASRARLPVTPPFLAALASFELGM
jgi:hypothetical protein